MATFLNLDGLDFYHRNTLPPGANLLHNADWGYSLVNQRNHSGAANSEYCIDRWIGSGTVTPSAGSHVTLAAGTSMEQHMEIISDALFGKTVTFSYEDSTGNVYSDTIVFPAASGQGIDARIGALYVEIGFISTSATNICGVSRTDMPYLFIRANSAVNVRRVWLELGGVSRIENSPPLDYATNLAICQRYYYKMYTTDVIKPATYFCVNATRVDVTLTLPVEMRLLPTVEFINTPQAQRAGGKSMLTVDTTVYPGVGFAGTLIYLYLAVSGIEIGDMGYLRLNNAGIILSADL